MRSDREDMWFVVFVTLLIAGLGLLTILFEMGTLSNLNDLPHRSTVASGMPASSSNNNFSSNNNNLAKVGGGMIPPKGALEDGVGGPTPARAKFEDPTPDSVGGTFQERFPAPAPTPPTIKNNAPAVTAAKRRHFLPKKWPLPAPTDHSPQISECAYIPGVMSDSKIVAEIARSLGCN
jgi:hypothetical protein